ncbi:MAG: AarF/ABC1/UbiB kinase family protein [Acidimicrobiales bacterium]|nr:AarF/ABC1/UbiB kinase family protein [Acidimicrobiales bacterium]
MKPARLALGVAAVAGAGAVAWRRAAPATRERLRRQERVVRLTARRAGHFAAVKLRGARLDEERRAELESRFVVRSAEDVARELGDMKGAVMKIGQMVSYVNDGLPPEAQAVLAGLQQDVPPMAPSLAESVVRDELGAAPDRLFLDWDPVPVAAASIGQVHRAVLHDGRLVAVKVQYPGIGRAIAADLDNAELLGPLVGAFSYRNVDVHALADELRGRMKDELDYSVEARNQAAFARRFRGHPFIRVPDVVAELSTARVLTQDWVDGWTWSEFLDRADEPLRQRAAEVIFRFAQSSVFHYLTFNGDPHPGNYKFHPDGSVTFLDFGLVKQWDPTEFAVLDAIIDVVLDRDPEGTVRAMVDAGFLVPDHGLDPRHVWEFVSGPYRPYLSDEFAFTADFTGAALGQLLDLAGPYADVIRALDMPPSFVVIDRLVWGVSALLGRLDAHNRWRGILAEYRKGAPPVTELGALEAAWRGR